MLTLAEAALALHGNQYREEGTLELFEQCKEAGIVVVFGASDDLIEFRGAIYDETPTGEVYLDADGFIPNKCDCDDCPYFAARISAGDHTTLKSNFGAEDYTFTYDINVTHDVFDIMEDDDKYCRGIVFHLSECDQ